MKKFKYNDSFAAGGIASGGTAGILIPPSIGFIIYGLITENSIGRLFMAGSVQNTAMVCILLVGVNILMRFMTMSEITIALIWGLIRSGSVFLL